MKYIYQEKRSNFIFHPMERFQNGGTRCKDIIDILLKLRSLDAIISEVPLILRYDMKKGGSKMKVVKTMKESMTLLLKRRFNLR